MLTRPQVLKTIASQLFLRSCATAAAPLVVRCKPGLPSSGNIIIPISMGPFRATRYESYNNKLETFFEYLVRYKNNAKKVDQRHVTILTTTELQWPREHQKIAEVEAHFKTRHQAALSQLTHFNWESFITPHQAQFDLLLKEVEEHSREGSEWHRLMSIAYRTLEHKEEGFAHSLEYQRNEYAASLLMAHLNYSHIVYMGHFSAASLYIQHVFPDKALTAVRAEVEPAKTKTANLDLGNAKTSTRLALQFLENVMSEPTLPVQEQQNFLSKVRGLLAFYEQQNIIKDSNNSGHNPSR